MRRPWRGVPRKQLPIGHLESPQTPAKQVPTHAWASLRLLQHRSCMHHITKTCVSLHKFAWYAKSLTTSCQLHSQLTCKALQSALQLSANRCKTAAKRKKAMTSMPPSHSRHHVTCVPDSLAKRCNVLCNSLQIVAKLQQNAKRPWQACHQMTRDIMSFAFLTHLQSAAKCFATLCKSSQTCSKTQKDMASMPPSHSRHHVICILNSLATRCNVLCNSLQIVAKLQQNAKRP